MAAFIVLYLCDINRRELSNKDNTN